jgi:hypothetical protein
MRFSFLSDSMILSTSYYIPLDENGKWQDLKVLIDLFNKHDKISS